MKQTLVLLLAVSPLPILALSQDKDKSPDASRLSAQEPTWMQKGYVSPSARIRHAIAYDTAGGQVVLFGGSGSGGILGDTWIWSFFLVYLPTIPK